MNRKQRRTQKSKPTIEQFLRSHLQAIKDAVGPQVSVTLVLGNPADEDTDTVMHDGNPKHAVLVLTRQMPRLVPDSSESPTA